MKILYPMSWLALSAALLAGCASGPKVFYHAGDETTPAFLTGPAAALLTNVDGFSAKLTASMPRAGGGRHTVTGDLLGRNGALIFQPASAVKGKRARTEGGMFFIWNEPLHSGYVLSDPLQAYAPTSVDAVPASVVINTNGAVEDEANGHPCRRVEAVVQSGDGSSERLQVWEAKDARHFPVRIRTETGNREMTLDFSEVRLELPPAEVFRPPDGFIRYPTPVALMNELIIRQSALARETGGRPEATSRDSGPMLDNWRPTLPQ
jgi:hypothetical protein